MKKITAIAIAVTLLASLTVAAAGSTPFEAVPGDALFRAMQALEDAQVQVSEGLPELALLENEFANKRMDALEQAADKVEGFGAEVLKALMGYLAESEGNLGSIIAQMAREKAGDDICVLEEIELDIDARGCRLAEMLEEGDLPEAALEGVKKALDNMAAAAEKAASAREMAEEGEPADAELPEVNLPEQAGSAPSVPGRP